jgi:hypothetical protein
MRSFSNLLGCLLLISFAFISSSCATAFKSSIKEDDIQIPAGFGKEKVTLLVIRHNERSYDKYLEKHFKNHYTGGYVIISRREISSEAYQDTEKYRYIFDEEVGTNSSRDAKGKSESWGFSRFYLKDRVTKKIYRTTHGVGSFGPWMKNYIKELERTRLKNKS